MTSFDVCDCHVKQLSRELVVLRLKPTFYARRNFDCAIVTESIAGRYHAHVIQVILVRPDKALYHVNYSISYQLRRLSIPEPAMTYMWLWAMLTIKFKIQSKAIKLNELRDSHIPVAIKRERVERSRITMTIQTINSWVAIGKCVILIGVLSEVEVVRSMREVFVAMGFNSELHSEYLMKSESLIKRQQGMRNDCQFYTTNEMRLWQRWNRTKLQSSTVRRWRENCSKTKMQFASIFV